MRYAVPLSTVKPPNDTPFERLKLASRARGNSPLDPSCCAQT
jgi:hypothetical protein